MKLQILGTGCAKCEKLAVITGSAAKNLGLDCDIEKVTDINAIMGFGVMVTPALVIDGEVVLAGNVPSQSDLEKLLQR